MSSVEIRPVQAAEMQPWLRTMNTALLNDPNAAQSTEFWEAVWQPERIFGGYADGRCVSTLRTFPTTLSVPGGTGDCVLLPADALTQVAVAGTHRRRGLLRQMLTQSLRDAKERGEVVSILRAAEWGIYGRFGYHPAIIGSNYTIRTIGRPTILPPRQPVDVVGVEADELLAPAMAVHRRVQLRGHGQIDRSLPRWQRLLGVNGMPHPYKREPTCVVARNAAGEVDGYAKWTGGDGDWFLEPDQAQADVHEVLAATDDAYRALWGYLIGLDLIRVLKLEAYAVDEPLEWLLSDGRAAQRTWTGDNDWLRLLDVPAALSARRYATTDRLVLNVVDDDGGWAAGRFTLDGGPDHADCTNTPTATADLTMSQRALAGVYLGGNTVESQRLAGLIDEETPGGLARLEAMCRTTRQPWNATPF